MKAFIETLGCPKNFNDTQAAEGFLLEDGFELSDGPDDADFIIVNTCGFINDAKRESIEKIFDMMEYREEGKKLIISGCLSQRYAEELAKEMPEVDRFIGVNDYDKLPAILRSLKEGPLDEKERAEVSCEYASRLPLLKRHIEEGADLVLVSGGMSVDPDDKTPGAIKDTGANVVTYGAPVLPGAMFLLAYFNADGKKIPIIGLPGCVMYAKRTIFDLVLPRVLAGEILSASDISSLGEGGLCLSCEKCTFPHCGFGK